MLRKEACACHMVYILPFLGMDPRGKETCLRESLNVSLHISALDNSCNPQSTPLSISS